MLVSLVSIRSVKQWNAESKDVEDRETRPTLHHIFSGMSNQCDKIYIIRVSDFNGRFTNLARTKRDLESMLKLSFYR